MIKTLIISNGEGPRHAVKFLIVSSVLNNYNYFISHHYYFYNRIQYNFLNTALSSDHYKNDITVISANI